MTKNKYIKVPVSERKPTDDRIYVCIWLDCNGDAIIEKSRYFMGSENNRFFTNTQPDFWLEEVSDREDEMREMLEEVFNYAKVWPLEGLPSQMEDKIENILNELKQTT